MTREQAAIRRYNAFESGRRARRAGCFRVLANPESADQLREWLRGWDSADAEIKTGDPGPTFEVQRRNG